MKKALPRLAAPLLATFARQSPSGLKVSPESRQKDIPLPAWAG